MEDARVKKEKVRDEVRKKLTALSESDIRQKTERVEKQLLGLANFKEAETALFYLMPEYAIDTRRIIHDCLQLPKNIILPYFDKDMQITLWKINCLETDLQPEKGYPDPSRCKPASFNDIDIAVIPGIAFDEKGGRTGTGRGHYDRMIPQLPGTARKVALSFSEQLFPHVPMESHDKHVDIIITDKRIIYKI